MVWRMSTRSVQVGGDSLTLCLDCGALLYPSHTTKHRDLHKQLKQLTKELQQLRAASKA
jgi:hypothetical protein